MGMMPARLIKPTVGLMPTMPQVPDGHTIEPSVSVPIDRAVRVAVVAAADPELEPHGLRSRTYGFRHWPPRALHPLDDRSDRILAHSLRLAFPRMIAPDSRSLFATVESCGGIDPSRASEPAVVVILSAVSRLSFRSTGIPCRGPRGPFDLRSASSASAI